MKRRAFLGTVGTGTVGAVAGCLGSSSGSSQGTTPQFTGESEDSGSSDTTSLADLPPLSGELTIYLGRGEGGLYKALLDHFQNERYPDLTLNVRRDSSSTLANTIVEEERNGASPADIFWSIDAGALGTVASRGIATTLTEEVTSSVPDRFHDPKHRWTGISGRARSIPYNTEQFSESDIPDSIAAIPQASRLDNSIGWAPTYGAFQSFVTAMRYTSGEAETKQWLESMLDAGVDRYSGEFLVTNAVAEGELGIGLTNHYYALRLQNAKPDAPLGIAFTKNDAGALVNSSGALVLGSSQQTEQARNLIRHLLSVEVQQFLADEAYEYPLVDGVSPPGGLPPVEELNPPPFDLTKLADVQETLSLLRETGVL